MGKRIGAIIGSTKGILKENLFLVYTDIQISTT